MASIRKSRNRWRAEVRRQGHKPLSKNFKSKAAAASWAREKETAMEVGDFHNLSNKSVADMIERYLEEYPDTKAYHKTILGFWKEELGRHKLSQIRKAHVIEARKTLQKRKIQKGPGKGKTLAPSVFFVSRSNFPVSSENSSP